jgi:cytidine deaminase
MGNAVDGTSNKILEAARTARENARAQFSGFAVGAALEAADGSMFLGCNIENVSYGLTMCAERVAVFKAISEGSRAFVRIAIVTDTTDAATPCGACRQVLWEFAGDIEVVVGNLAIETGRYRLRELLPQPFDSRFLE